MRPNVKKLLVTSLLILGVNSFANDGGKVTNTKASTSVKEIEDVSKTFDEELGSDSEKNPSQTAKLISGKKEAIKKVQTTFKYDSNAIYEIYVSPDYNTRIELNADENVTYIGGGDTQNWQVDMSRGGENNATSVYLRPTDTDLKTNFIIQTDKRTYTFYINGDETMYNVLVKFSYPFSNVMNVYKNELPLIKETNNNIDIENDISKINANYVITNKHIDFAPKSIFNNGSKTYIRFKETLDESPILVVKGSDGKLEEVNYHEENGVIRIDRVIKSGQLKLGKKTVKFELK